MINIVKNEKARRNHSIGYEKTHPTIRKSQERILGIFLCLILL